MNKAALSRIYCGEHIFYFYLLADTPLYHGSQAQDLFVSLLHQKATHGDTVPGAMTHREREIWALLRRSKLHTISMVSAKISGLPLGKQALGG
jgi:hypothetical protein